MIEELLNEIHSPEDISSITSEIVVPEMPDFSLSENAPAGKDIFSVKSRKAWDKTEEARCDFQFRPRLVHRASTAFISIWQKSVFGRTLTDIKADDDMVPFFADNLAPVIREVLGRFLSSGDWALVTTPMRRHKERNFATLIAERLAASLAVPFYFDCAHCHSRHRVGAVFEAHNIPREHNVIVFDDFVTTGSTLRSMRELLEREGRNPIFFCGINNKI